MAKPKLTPDEFEKTISTLNATEQTIEITRGVLVDGIKQTFFCEKFGLTKGAISLAVKRVYDAYKKTVYPPGYEKVTEILPARQAYIVKKWGKKAREKNNNKF